MAAHGSHNVAHKSQSVIGSIALALTIIGAINWGLVGLLGFNVVTALFGENSALTTLTYLLVGLSGLYALTLYPRVARAPHKEHSYGPDYGPGHPDFIERRRTLQPSL